MLIENSRSGDKPARYVFSVFTFDVESGDLTRNRHTLRIRKQTSRLLTILLERAGSVVTREELRELLWPDGEYLDHDQAINRVVNQLRMVLRDDPRTPRFIETLPKRGYRFCSEVMVEAPERLTADAENPAEGADGPGSIELVARTSELPVVDASAAGTRFASPRAGWLRLAFAGGILALLIGSALLFWARTGRGPQHRTVRMGIVPFDSQGQGATRLAESFRLDLMDTMSQLPNVELHAAHSLDRSGLDEVGLQKLASMLQLDVLLMGHFVVENGQCTLQLELVRAGDMAHLKSYQYTSPEVGLASVRRRVQRDVFADLQVAGAPLQRVRGSTEDAQAYNDYLQAREALSRRSIDSLNQAARLFHAAIDRDPGFAQAYSGLSAAHLALADSPGFADHLPLARQFAEAALQRDSNLAEAHAVLGGVALRLDWNPAHAESELRSAVELEPHYTVYHAWLAEALVCAGRFEEALKEVDLARDEDPLWNQVYMVDVLASGVSHQHARMIAAARRYLDLFPESTEGRDLLAWSYFTAGNYKDAIEQWRTMAEIEKDDARVVLEKKGWAAFQRGGLKAYAAVRLRAIESADKGILRHPNDFVPAEWYACAGNRDRAIGELRKTIDRHENDAMEIAVNPMFDSLHHDPEFLSLIARIGLTVPTSFPEEQRRPDQQS